MAPRHGEYWLVSVPNKGSPNDATAKTATWKELTSTLKDVADVHSFDIPDLRTGTLDRLMNAADNLQRVDLNIEQAIRKIERQFTELSAPSEQSSLHEVEEVPVLQYLEHFTWNTAKYPTSRQIDELIKSITQQTFKLEEELKESSLYLQEKKQALAAIQRKKQGNLSVIDLEDIVTPQVIAAYDLVDTEYIKDMLLLVPKNIENTFLNSYDTLAGSTVTYSSGTGSSGGSEVGKVNGQIEGSPVVPRSAQKLSEDKEYALYAVKCLKTYTDELKSAAISNRYLVREFDIHGALVGTAGGSSTAKSHSRKEEKEKEKDQVGMAGTLSLEAAEEELARSTSQLRRWCQAHYSEAFMAWIHVKALRVFTESALRYGIPVNIGCVLIGLDKKGSGHSGKTRVRAKLMEKYKGLDESGMMSMDKDEHVGNAQATSGATEEVFPYVFFGMSVFGAKDR